MCPGQKVEMRVRWLLWNRSQTQACSTGVAIAVTKHKSPLPDLSIAEAALAEGLKLFPTSANLHVLAAQYVIDYRHHTLVEKDHLTLAEVRDVIPLFFHVLKYVG
jgi:hypothetical protein